MGELILEVAVLAPGLLIHRILNGERGGIAEILKRKSAWDEFMVTVYGVLFWGIIIAGGILLGA